MLSGMRSLGIRVVPSLHCTFWPAGFRPTGFAKRFIRRLDGLFWRYCADATVAISPECERQVRAITNHVRGPIYQARALFDQDFFLQISPPQELRVPFCILYVGRIEADKGVFDLLEMAGRLEESCPDTYRWDVCGAGSQIDQVREQVRLKKLSERVFVHGACDRTSLSGYYGASHLVIVPTTSRFCEGLNKVALEAILAGRPLLTSRVSPALEIVRDAAYEVEPDDICGYVDALERARTNLDEYSEKRRSCERIASQIADQSQKWGTVVQKVLHCFH